MEDKDAQDSSLASRWKPSFGGALWVASLGGATVEALVPSVAALRSVWPLWRLLRSDSESLSEDFTFRAGGLAPSRGLAHGLSRGLTEGVVEAFKADARLAVEAGESSAQEDPSLPTDSGSEGIFGGRPSCLGPDLAASPHCRGTNTTVMSSVAQDRYSLPTDLKLHVRVLAECIGCLLHREEFPDAIAAENKELVCLGEFHLHDVRLRNDPTLSAEGVTECPGHVEIRPTTAPPVDSVVVPVVGHSGVALQNPPLLRWEIWLVIRREVLSCEAAALGNSSAAVTDPSYGEEFRLVVAQGHRCGRPRLRHVHDAPLSSIIDQCSHILECILHDLALHPSLSEPRIA
eukprot:CAMPEP_0115336190 /NCGR_PEP_ID=MMETSP0270-20121206/88877_1 /TAXON_ID=71861 /ORGANISM="Scrippsiella trochoidea, Strain CCMP3099" /LENGTH=345 /DNA_ID=CAMNT_0002757353 /DNA_START=70 /DNA_END=1108 /DNA_ORIENTATION=-